MTADIVWRPDAELDLLSIYEWIAENGDAETALDYIRRVTASLEILRDHPRVGAPRADLGDGVRTLVYRRRAVTAYRIVGHNVEILHVAYGGRDLRMMFDDD